MRNAFMLALGVSWLAACSPRQRPPEFGDARTTGAEGIVGITAVPQTTTASPPGYGAGPAVAPETTPSQGDDDALTEAAAPHRGLVRAALELPSLTPTQTAQIRSLLAQKEATNTPVRAARIDLLDAVADALDTGTVSTITLAPKVQGLVSAIETAEPTNRVLLENLHAVLSPPQRADLVRLTRSRIGTLEAKWAEEGGPRDWMVAELGLAPTQMGQIRTSFEALEGTSPEALRRQAKEDLSRLLEAFEGATFLVDQVVPRKGAQEIQAWVERPVVRAQAAAPVLTAEQRARAASILRTWAARPQ